MSFTLHLSRQPISSNRFFARILLRVFVFSSSFLVNQMPSHSNIISHYLFFFGFFVDSVSLSFRIEPPLSIFFLCVDDWKCHWMLLAFSTFENVHVFIQRAPVSLCQWCHWIDETLNCRKIRRSDNNVRWCRSWRWWKRKRKSNTKTEIERRKTTELEIISIIHPTLSIGSGNDWYYSIIFQRNSFAIWAHIKV